MDVLTKEQRHRNMTNIRSKDTKPELKLRKLLWHEGVRYRKNLKTVPGKPDLVISRYMIAIFVDGEFWHGKAFNEGEYEGHKYRCLKEQLEHGNNSEFWMDKIQKNMERDRQVEAKLTKLGWTVLRFWSKDVLKHPDECLKVVKDTISEKSVAQKSTRDS